MPDAISRFVAQRLINSRLPVERFPVERLPVERLPVEPPPAERVDIVALDRLRFSPSRLVLQPRLEPPSRLAFAHVEPTVLRALRSLGRLPGPHPVAQTRAEFQRFQRSRDLPDDGEFGPEDALELATALNDGGDPEAAAEVIANAAATDPETFEHAVAWTVLERGGNGSLAVEFVQLRLNQLGYGTLTVDGDFGAQTEEAVRRMQSAAGLAADGVVRETTWLALLQGQPTLRKGDTAEVLKVAQRRLNELNYGDLKGSGVFGDRTLDALHGFQVESGLQPSDEVNTDTWRYLFAVGAVSTPVGVLTEARAELLSRMNVGLHLLPASERARVAAVITAAVESYGIHEKPEGSNRGPDVDALVGKRAWPWCALAVSAWLKRGLGASSWSEIPLGSEMAGVNSIRNWGFKQSRFLPTTNVPPGAILIMNRRTGTATPPSQSFDIGHTGLVIEDRGSTVITIEGNSQDSVRSNERDKSTLVGFVRWWG